MSKRIIHIVGTAMAAGALALLPSAAAQAEETPRQAAESSYVLSVTTESGATSSASLSCQPPSGSHPYANEVCVQLNRADGHIAAIPAQEGPCTLEYAPVTVTATGYWRGELREYSETFPNQCVAVRDTGGYLFNL